MDEVLDLAAKLSGSIARSARFLDLRKAEADVMSNDDALSTLKRRDELLTRLREKESKGEPIEPEEKRELAALDEGLKANTELTRLSRAQANFQELMNLVNERIASALEPAKPKEPEAPAPEQS